MSNATGGKMSSVSVSEKRRIDRFLDVFADIEKALKKRLKLKSNDPTGVSKLIERFQRSNPCWSNDSDDLRSLKDIRDILSHQRSISEGYPLIVTCASSRRLEKILNRIVKPVPVCQKYGHRVTTVCPDDSLAKVVAMAYEKGFSQFPIVDGGRFCGLLTENGITRWLGRTIKMGRNPVDLSRTKVKRVVKEEEQDRQQQVFKFVRSDAPVDEVMGFFARRPMLEAVLLTPTGTNKTPIEGIVTSWNAARFTG